MITNLNTKVQKLSSDLDSLQAALNRILASSGPRPYREKLDGLLRHLLKQARNLLHNINTTTQFIEELNAQQSGEVKIEALLQIRELYKIKQELKQFVAKIIEKLGGL